MEDQLEDAVVFTYTDIVKKLFLTVAWYMFKDKTRIYKLRKTGSGLGDGNYYNAE